MARVTRTEVLQPDAAALRHAADVLRHDGLVAFPTDTVYGVGALPSRAVGLQRLEGLKSSPAETIIAMLAASPADLATLAAEVSPGVLRLAQRFWPGPLTLLVPRHPSLPAALAYGPGLGVRVPDHPLLRQLLQLTGPLATTTANRSGAANALTALDVQAQLAGRVDLILDGGRVLGGLPSTVVDCSGPEPKILREGPITLTQILSAWAQPPLPQSTPTTA